ncbi:hypothetical protein [Leucobacter insecticola]|uniref:hypothetical protein n=1 Tax=Leucobacter insecticola TaxID=2714934 RepID=UPI001FCB61A2|nr:hypothetical protein [Leucobacter insecticola]
MPEFTAASADLGAADACCESWLAVLARSAELGPDDDRAIIRDNTTHGYPTRSLLVCLAEIGTGVGLASATLAEPGVWGAPRFVTAPDS